MQDLTHLGKFQHYAWLLAVIVFGFSSIDCTKTAQPIDGSSSNYSGTFLSPESGKTYSENETVSSVVNYASSVYSYTTLVKETVVFPWNKTTTTAREYQTAFCGRACHGKRFVYLPKPARCSLIECFLCDCDKPRCQDYGTCCPDYQELPPVNSSISSGNSTNTKGQNHVSLTTNHPQINPRVDQSLNLKLGCDGRGKHRVLYIRSCPSHFPRSNVTTKCEGDVQLGDQDLATFLHVTDKVTSHTYFNEHCATCNAVTDFISWDLSVKCDSYINVYQASSLEEFVTLAQASDSRCNLSQTAPHGVLAYRCPGKWLSSASIATCNLTGMWRVYDAEVERGCAEQSTFTDLVRHVNTGPHIFRNLFCAICNMDGFPEFSNWCPESAWNDGSISERTDVFNPFLPFSVLFNFNSRGSLRINSKLIFIKCSDEKEWTSPDNKCIPLQCSPGKILTNGSCSTAVSLIRGLVYRIRITYWPRLSVNNYSSTDFGNTCAPVTSPNDYLALFKDSLDGVLSGLVEEADFQLMMTFSGPVHRSQEGPLLQNETNTSCFGLLDQVVVNRFALDGFVMSSHMLSRSEAETQLVDALITSSINISVGLYKLITLTPMLTADRRDQHLDCKTFTNEGMSCIQTRFNQSRDEEYNYMFNLDKQGALFLEPVLSCPFVSFNPTQFMYNSGSSISPGGSSIILSIGGAFILISEIHELNLLSIADDGTLKVCKELLDKKPFPVSYRRNSLIVISQYILTLVCLSASILCLSVTLMTYSLLPVLRSVAGKNNMFLCGSLLLAQSSLLATSHVQPNSPLCTFFAISTHFLWLSMFCWCFTSCLHMFLTFSAKTRSVQTTASSERKYIIKRAVACSVVPALIVITVVVVNYFTSQGRLIGYGQTTCFLDSPMLIGMTMFAPMCLILVSNFCFFIMTVVKINNIFNLRVDDTRRDHRTNLYIYFKLSSLTGMFWLLVVLSEATNNDPLRLIAISLNGLQGVFIFLSYICNKRVLRLYSIALRSETPVPRSTSQKSTLSKVVFNVRHDESLNEQSGITNNLSVESSQLETASVSVKSY